MQITVCVITILYGFLSIAAPLTQLKDKGKRVPMSVMLCGGVLLIASAILKLFSLPGAVAAAAVGSLAACAAAVMNGVKNGKVHISHHVIRIVVSCALIVGFLLG